MGMLWTQAAAMDVSAYYAGLVAISPEMILTLGVVALLMLEAFRPDEDDGLGNTATNVSLLFLGLALFASVALQIKIVGPAPGHGLVLFSGMIVVDPFASFFRVLSCIAGIGGVLIAMPSREVRGKRDGEYHALFLALVVGMMFMAEASDLLMLYLAIELVSFMSYVLAGFRPHDRKSAEASLKYVIFGGGASGVMLFGFSLLYGITGESQLALINEKVVVLVEQTARLGLTGAEAAVLPIAVSAGIVLSFAGFAYKIAAVPLHMWSPDVYEGAPTPFTAFLSTGPKAAAFAALVRFFVVGFSEDSHFAAETLLSDVTTLPWPQLIIIVSILTMTLGNLAAIGQSNIKRFLAYSSIAHAGYSLIGLAAFSRAGVSAVLMYMVFYVAMNIGAFYCVIWVRQHIGSERIDDYKGIGFKAPFICVCMTICLFSLTGLPPLAGFIGKFYLFAAVLDRAAYYPELAMCVGAARETLGMFSKMTCSLNGGGVYYWLAVIGVLNSAVSVYYYARVVRKMFLEVPDDPTPIAVGWHARLVLGPICAALVLLGVYWAPLQTWTDSAVRFRRPSRAELQLGETPAVAHESRRARALGAKNQKEIHDALREATERTPAQPETPAEDAPGGGH